MANPATDLWAPSFYASLTSVELHAASRNDRDAVHRAYECLEYRSTSADESAETPRTHLNGIAVQKVLTQLRAGDRDALSTIYKALFTELWHIALLQTRSGELAKEIVHDVFLWLWTRRTELRTDTDIRVYLAVAVRNRARNMARHDRVVLATHTVHYEGATVQTDDVPAFGAPTPAPDQQLEDREFRVAYDRAITTLTERERFAVFLRWEEGWSFEQIGQMLSLSKVGARKVVLRAQQKVQELLAAYRD